ncbi:unnamed protein product [Coffea canephora]|uniref:tRNA-intron lyase n=1 Tax=Coffea canephora TaxID=49390 RepID=A0A068VMZ7_COFCA|nr:unnamed protein product [Coffea canephora]
MVHFDLVLIHIKTIRGFSRRQLLSNHFSVVATSGDTNLLHRQGIVTIILLVLWDYYGFFREGTLFCYDNTVPSPCWKLNFLKDHHCFGSCSNSGVLLLKDVMGPRWKGKGAEAKALADPISTIVSQLQSSLVQSSSQGLLMNSSVLFEADAKQTDLLNRACFGRPVVTAEKDKQWFQLGLEEAFYLFYVLKCIKIVNENNSEIDSEELWMYMTSKKENFPNLFKAYSHLRMKNWVVRSGSQYGVDFVAYRHHPSLVHSEYAVIVLSDNNGETNGRLMVWSDYHCTLRLCGSVAKTLLLLNIDKCGENATLPSCLESYIVEERTITRWSPQQCREKQTIATGES